MPETGACVAGVGHRLGGDDGVGLEVVDWLERQRLPGSVRLHRIEDPSELVALMEGPGPLIVVDAAIVAAGHGAAPGTVRLLAEGELEGTSACPLSTHGLSVRGAIELGRALGSDMRPCPVTIVAVVVAPPPYLHSGLSLDVARAVPGAGAEVLRLLAGSAREA